MDYQSTLSCRSAVFPWVRYRIRRPSLGARIQLTAQLAEVVRKMQYHLGSDSPEDQANAAHLCARADEIYLRWGLVEVKGLEIDGQPATVDTLIAQGPDLLVREVLARIHAETHISESERKNC